MLVVWKYQISSEIAPNQPNKKVATSWNNASVAR